MANPSLQIGNSKWAIKEDNELGYSSSGTRFFPIPITMTRASAGTRVNPQGLVETVELLGSELVTNGDFELNSDWGNFSSPTTSEQSTEQSHTGTYSWKIIADATQEGIASPNNFNLTSGLTYSVSLWIYSVSGNSIKSGLNNTNVSVFTERTVTVGEWTNITYMATASSTGASYISILSQNSLNFFVDNVSVKESTKNDLARVDYDGTASSLLVEPQRTNLITYSSDFSQWSSSGGMAVTLNNTTSPSGDVNATLLVTSNANDVIYTNVSSTIASTFSVYVKWKVGSGNIDLSSDGGSSYTSLPVTEGWTRISISPIAIANQVALRIPTSGSELWVWGAQLEEGSYGTSYIPTSGSTVTRVQDQYSKTGISSKINSEEGVLFLEVAALSLTSILEILTLSDGSYSNVVMFRYYDTSSNDIQVQVRVAGVTTASILFTLTDAKDFNKIAFKYKENDFALWVNGVEVGTDTSGITFTSSTLNKLSFDRGDGGNALFGKVKQLQVFKTALTDTELATLTT